MNFFNNLGLKFKMKKTFFNKLLHPTWYYNKKLIDLVKNFDENKVLSIIEEKSYLDRIDVNYINTYPIDEDKRPLFSFCIYHEKYKIAEKLLQLNDLDLDFKRNKQFNIFFTLASTNKYYNDDDKETLIELILNKNPTYPEDQLSFLIQEMLASGIKDKIIHKMINYFKVDITAKTYYNESDMLTFALKADIPFKSFQALLDTNQYSKERLQDFAKEIDDYLNINYRAPYQKEITRKLIQLEVEQLEFAMPPPKSDFPKKNSKKI